MVLLTEVFQDEPGLVFPSEQVPLLTTWIQAMEKDPAVAQYALPSQVDNMDVVGCTIIIGLIHNKLRKL